MRDGEYTMYTGDWGAPHLLEEAGEAGVIRLDAGDGREIPHIPQEAEGLEEGDKRKDPPSIPRIRGIRGE